MSAALLEVDRLRVEFAPRAGESLPLLALDDISFSIRAGEILGLVGESGAGKSLTGAALVGLLEPPGRITGGEIRFAGERIDGLSESQWQAWRGSRIGVIFQDPLTSLDPLFSIGQQLVETLRAHSALGAGQARRRAIELLDEVGIPAAEGRLAQYPHQFSGGMRQRVVIALALAARPPLIIADEPTTALDVTIQAQVLGLLRDLVRDSDTALILITHDLGVVAGTCDQVHVMYSGRIVESGERHSLFARPRHHYTLGLLGSVPRLDAAHGGRLTPIPGSPRDTISWDEGCAFAPRCAAVTEACLGVSIDLVDNVRCVNPAVAAPVGSVWEASS
jgi:peptide/nickel transport system ATP-binding protein